MGQQTAPNRWLNGGKVNNPHPSMELSGHGRSWLRTGLRMTAITAGAWAITKAVELSGDIDNRLPHLFANATVGSLVGSVVTSATAAALDRIPKMPTRWAARAGALVGMTYSTIVGLIAVKHGMHLDIPFDLPGMDSDPAGHEIFNLNPDNVSSLPAFEGAEIIVPGVVASWAQASRVGTTAERNPGSHGVGGYYPQA